MSPLLQALIGPGAVALTLGTAIAVDRWREPRRDPRRPIAVVDARTYRYALRRVARLDPNERLVARAHLTACREWSRREIHTGGSRRRAQRAAALEQVELRLAQLDAPSGLYR